MDCGRPRCIGHLSIFHSKSTMNEDITRRFESLQVWRSGTKRAPHKPLLLLWALGRCLHGYPRLTSFDHVDTELRKLLYRFGPHRKTVHTEDPFWRLQRDEVWEIDRPDRVRSTADGSGALKSDLRKHATQGGLRAADYRAFKSDPNLIFRIAGSLVASHFPITLHDEIFEATLGESHGSVDIDIEIEDEWVITKQRRRDPYFREKVFTAYGARCAVCEFAGELHGRPLALEAAHIKWHEAKGPGIVENGLVLCSLHHRLFDKGAFTLSPDLKIIVSNSVQGEGVDNTLYRFNGSTLKGLSIVQSPKPDLRFIAWHREEVFRIRDAVY